MKRFCNLCALCVILFSISVFAKNWTPATGLDSNNNGNLFNIIKSYDDIHCIIVGSDGSGIPRIIKSDDAGKTWKYIYNTTIIEYFTDTTLKFHKPYAAHYDSKRIAVLAYDNIEKQTYYLESMNKGETWSKKIIPFAALDLYFEGDKGIMITKDSIYLSSDGAKTWVGKSSKLNDLGGNLDKVRFTSLNKFSLLIVNQEDSKAYICTTEDGGENRKTMNLPYYSRYVSFSNFGDSYFNVCGSNSNGNGDQYNDVIIQTTDAGATWNKIMDSAISDSVSLPFGCYDIENIDENQIMAVGSTVRALYSSDKGKSWKLLSAGLENSSLLFYSVKFLKPNVVIACGWENLVARLELETTEVKDRVLDCDALQVYPNPANNYIHIDFNTESNLRIYTQEGLLVKENAYTNNLYIGDLANGFYILSCNGAYKKFLKI